MNSDWLFALVFYPSFAIVICLLSAFSGWKKISEIYDEAYELGRNHGKREAFLETYKFSADRWRQETDRGRGLFDEDDES